MADKRFRAVVSYAITRPGYVPGFAHIDLTDGPSYRSFRKMIAIKRGVSEDDVKIVDVDVIEIEEGR